MEWHSNNIHKEHSSNNPDQESTILNGILHDFTSIQPGKCWECLKTGHELLYPTPLCVHPAL